MVSQIEVLVGRIIVMRGEIIKVSRGNYGILV